MSTDYFSLPVWNSFGGQITPLQRASHWGHTWRKELGWLELLYLFFRQDGWTRIFHYLESCNLEWGSQVSVVPSLFGIREQFHRRQYFHRQEEAGWFWDDSKALHLLCTLFQLLLHQLHLRSSGSRSQRLGTPAFGDLKKTAHPVLRRNVHAQKVVHEFQRFISPLNSTLRAPALEADCSLVNGKLEFSSLIQINSSEENLVKMKPYDIITIFQSFTPLMPPWNITMGSRVVSIISDTLL